MTYHIAHFADTHIGYRAKVGDGPDGTNIRVQDGYNALKEIVNQIISSKVKIDAVVIAGDLFHGSRPSPKDIAVVHHLLRELSKRGIPVYVLAGNHDATDVRAELAANAVVSDPDRKIFSLFTKPYERYELADGLLLHSVAHHGLALEDTPIIEASTKDINIFTTHGAALDPKNHALLNCAESPREQIIPMELVMDDVFAAKLLGHYHSRYQVGGDTLNTVYAGSTIRRGFSDEPGERGWWLVAVHDNGEVDFTPQNIKQRPQYDLKTIDGLDKSAGDIMDLIEMNLTGTNEGDAPIIRQKVLNAPRSIREGLNRERIRELTKHALQWQLEFPANPANAAKNSDGSIENRMSFTKKNDIIGQYSEWATHNTSNIPAEFRDSVVDIAQKMLKKALETGTDDHVHH